MVAQLKKICLVASKSFRREILSFLQELGTVEIIDLGEGHREEKEMIDLNYQLARVKFAIDFLAPYQKKEKVSLKQKITTFLSPKIKLTKQELNKTVSQTPWAMIIQETEKLEMDFTTLSSKIKKIQEEKEKVYPWRKLDLNLAEIKKTKNFSFLTGKISLINWPKFLEKIKNEIKLTEVIKVDQLEKDVYCLIIFDRVTEKDLLKFLEENQFIKIELPPFKSSPAQYFERLEDELAILEPKMKIVRRKISRLANQQEKLKIIFDWLSWQKEKEEVKQKIQKTNFTLFLFAWVVKDSLPDLQSGLRRITPEFEIIEMPVKADEEVPVLLKNKEFVNDFETVTNVYGVPKYHEPDPTPFLTPFFVLFFALCLSDAGYGLVLTIISITIIKFLNLPQKTKNFFRLFLWLGLTTIFIGAILGSWFGLELETLPEFLKPVKEFLIQIRIIDPIKNPLQLLIISLVLGVFQILAGLIINLYWKIKNKDTLNAILDNGPWIFLISSLLIFIGSQSKFLSISHNLAKYLVLIGLILVVLTQGRKQKNIFLKIPAGVLSLYGLIGYLSDTLSYSRLLALGLATSIIGMVINLIAKIFSQMIPFVGFILAIFILIGGHLFNIGINALGAFIHSARLQFVEFFPKFMEGGGVRFKPFRKEGKYVQLINYK
ncbi:MAG: V-type ATP synthase subunit I [Patescibacteria group bacterium]|nr:V-type ATP synthase subunit I [Patescibacteria group bacterium]